MSAAVIPFTNSRQLFTGFRRPPSVVPAQWRASGLFRAELIPGTPPYTCHGGDGHYTSKEQAPQLGQKAVLLIIGQLFGGNLAAPHIGRFEITICSRVSSSLMAQPGSSLGVFGRQGKCFHHPPVTMIALGFL